MHKKGDFRIKKSLGQNFLKSEETIEKIIDAADVKPGDTVIEIGSGTGALTVPLADRADRVIAIELDESVIPILKRNLAGRGNVTVINADILETDIKDLHGGAGEPCTGNNDNAMPDAECTHTIKIIGNLPYYITTPIIMKLLEEGVNADSITVMMQKEVAERIMAPAGVKAYGELTIAVRYYCEPEMVCEVSRDEFYPVPAVDSAVLKLRRRKEPVVRPIDEKLFFACIKQAFATRRKTLANCLTGFRSMDKQQAHEVIKEAGFDPVARAETLDIADFAKLADEIARRKG